MKAGLDRAKAERKLSRQPPALKPEQVQEYRRRYTEAPSIRRVERITKGSEGTANRALEIYVDTVAHMR